VVDWALFCVMKWRAGVGEVVAGGNGQGADSNQLNNPIGLFLDQNRTLYVVDRSNHCVTKWEPGAKEGIVVAGGHGQGANLSQFDSPTGIVVDALGTIYVTDRLNHRVIRWPKGASSGTVIAGGNNAGNETNQLNGGFDLAFDRYGNLYVSDDGNYRIQMFTCNGKLLFGMCIDITLIFHVCYRRISVHQVFLSFHFIVCLLLVSISNLI
jgi:DNA-binding beta-propeller fold protein YncE